MSYDEWRPSRWHQAGGPLHLRTAPAPAGVTDGRWPVAAVRSEANGGGGGGSIPPFVTTAPTVAGRLDLVVGGELGRLAPENCFGGSGREHACWVERNTSTARGAGLSAPRSCGCKPSQPGTICFTLCDLPPPRSAKSGHLATTRAVLDSDAWQAGTRRTSTRVERVVMAADARPGAIPPRQEWPAPTPPRQEWPAAHPVALRVAANLPPRVAGSPQPSDPGPWSQFLPRRHARAGSCPGTPAHVQIWRAQRPPPRTLGLNRPNRAYSPHLADRRPPDANSGHLQSRALNRSPP